MSVDSAVMDAPRARVLPRSRPSRSSVLTDSNVITAVLSDLVQRKDYRTYVASADRKPKVTDFTIENGIARMDFEGVDSNGKTFLSFRYRVDGGKVEHVVSFSGPDRRRKSRVGYFVWGPHAEKLDPYFART